MPKAAAMLGRHNIDAALVQMVAVSRLVSVGETASEAVVELPVLGSYKLRHVGRRDEAFFFKSSEFEDDQEKIVMPNRAHLASDWFDDPELAEGITD